MRADNTTVLDPNGPGRDTVRFSRKKQYGYSIMILARSSPATAWLRVCLLLLSLPYLTPNVSLFLHFTAHVAPGPRFWTNSNNNTWPTSGEIDIIEGVNDEVPNASVLHTSPNHACPQSDSSMDDRGVLVSEKCTSAVGDRAGCRVNHDTDKSYGPELNAVGGGCSAMERTSHFVNVWFWARDDENVPDDVKDAATWKQTTLATLDVAIKPQKNIINLSLCGDWAGNAYPSTCPSTCVDHVNNDPAAFKDAYWDIASLTILSPTSSGASKRHHHSHKRNYF
ncbi:hypothetical protein M407DRAFT_32838 [Tulasnella calospora MUT 4182]|uniref:Glycoside hydrolase family 16 protein n=1 Tax=Tulasnella calospora MUT 4182 TaxID=1051891 RepID=A0A0C3PS34_9AGAM|nr:hypothetical protein M407DRAFT_32838 [Tulasnella calospora MUT 4182]